MSKKSPAQLVCDLLELADHRALANDGPVGNGSDCFNELSDYEKRRFYLACRKLCHITPKHEKADEERILADIVIRGLSAKIKRLESNLAPTLALMNRLAAGAKADRELNICYRLGKAPTEALFKRLEDGRQALTDYEAHKKERG